MERWDTFVVYLKPVIEHAISNVVFCFKTRMHKDGRLPQTFRLTIRRYSATNKWFSRESRQAPIPNHVAQKISSGKLRDTAARAPDTYVHTQMSRRFSVMSAGSRDEAVVQLLPLAMKLFHKMVDSSAAFHLTLINVCFSNLQTRAAATSTKGSITSFFTHSTSPRKPPDIVSTERQVQ